MGLSMTVFRTQGMIPEPVDFYFREWENPTTVPDYSQGTLWGEEIFYWRKNIDLHGWFERLYKEKGGAVDEFYGPVELTADDIENLWRVVYSNGLPEYQTTNDSGRYPDGQPGHHWREHDLRFIKKARKQLEKGYKLFYDSSW